jgi:hypothetical protein
VSRGFIHHNASDKYSSGSFSVNIDPKTVIELHSFTTNVGVRFLDLAECRS